MGVFPDETETIPLSRLARAGELGILGARLSGLMLRASAAGLVHPQAAKEQLWTQAHLDAATALFETLGRMRGAAAKLGQLLAQRPGLLPEQYIETMFELSNRVPPMGYPMVKTQFLNAFGVAPTKLFASFERSPVAAASFGQVHRARLSGGHEVAVKVQYPAIDLSLGSDLDNLRMLVEPVSRLANVRYAAEAFEELQVHIERELDYQLEAENLRAFGEVFRSDPTIVVPAVLPDLTRRKVLTLDYLDGVDVRGYLDTAPQDAERQHFARQLLRFGWVSILRHGLLHADPNPGNFLFLPGGRLGVVDFGCVKRFEPAFLGTLKRMVRATTLADEDEMIDAARAGRLLTDGASVEQRQTILRMLRLWGRPFRDGVFDFGARTYLDDLLKLQTDLRAVVARREAIPVPPEWLFYGRHIIGTTYLLHRLGARGDFGSAIAPYLASDAESGS